MSKRKSREHLFDKAYDELRQDEAAGSDYRREVEEFEGAVGTV